MSIVHPVRHWEFILTRSASRELVLLRPSGLVHLRSTHTSSKRVYIIREVSRVAPESFVIWNNPAK